MSKIKTYSQKFVQMDKEASATLFLSICITVFFWLIIYLTKDSDETIFLMPSWFVISCIGGYCLSVIGVVLLVKFCMKNFSLDSDDDSSDGK